MLAPLPELRRHGMDTWRAQTRISAQEAALVPMLEIAVLAVAGLLLLRGRITPGELFAAVQYVALAAGLGSVATSLGGWARCRSAAGRLADVLDQPLPAQGREPLPPGAGRLDFRAVTVHGGDRPALQSIDLTVPAGTMVAVVGRSGSGKSALAALAARLVDPDEGAVTLDGVSLSRLARTELRRAIAVGSSHPVLIGETLTDVIALGLPACSPAQVQEAARSARADGFIRRLPRGYRTPLADAPMSGGEVQRVGLARAFVRAERVLVLDDVAASLDTVTEHHISQVLRTSLADRTRLVVAHRASTAARADVVVWLEAGSLRRCGPHADLWSDPDYRAVFTADPIGAGSGGAP